MLALTLAGRPRPALYRQARAGGTLEAMRSLARRCGLLAAVVLGAAALGGAAGSAPVRAAPPISAREVADQLLSQAALPPRATQTARVVSNLLNGPFERPGMSALTDVDRLFIVPGPPGAVITYVESHLPAAAKGNGDSTLSEPGSSASGTIVSFPARGGHLYLSQLLYLVAADGFSASELRVDAEVVWLPNRPKSEFAPAGGIVELGGSMPSSSSGELLGPLRARQLRAVLNTLPLGPTVLYIGGPTSPFSGALYSLVFRPRTSAPPSFEASATDLCGSMTVFVYVHGRAVTPLSDSRCRLLNAVQGEPPGYKNPKCLPPIATRPTGATS